MSSITAEVSTEQRYIELADQFKDIMAEKDLELEKIKNLI